MDDSELSSLFYSYQDCASSSTGLPMATYMTSNSISTNVCPAINPFEEAATNFVQQEPPLEVKNELKKAIQEKKIAKGEEIPQIEWKKPPTPQPRPPEKPEDIQLRRQKNKIAAKKCREKKREKKLEYRKKIEKQQEKQLRLMREVKGLRKECRELKAALQSHHCILNSTCVHAQPLMNHSTTALEQLAQQNDFSANLLQMNLNCSLPPQ